MVINLESCNFDIENIKKIESYYKGKYICDTQIKYKNNNWINVPVSIFYQEIPHPKGSNYFGLYFLDEQLMITDGISATKDSFIGIQDNNQIIYSRYRHDFRQGSQCAIDGGRDYVRLVGDVSVKQYNLQIIKDKLIILT